MGPHPNSLVAIDRCAQTWGDGSGVTRVADAALAFIFGACTAGRDRAAAPRVAIIYADEAHAGSFLREHWLVTVLWISLSHHAWEDSHADFWVIAEDFYQNDRCCRGCHLWARRGC
jgi:hypothetical protein